MDVSIEEITFDHDRNSATTDALTIRKNEHEDIAVPEWQAGQNGVPQTSAAAYARSQGNNLTLVVRLKKHNAAVQSVEISAQSNSVLGNVIRQPIAFDGTTVLSDPILLPLSEVRLSSAVVGRTEVDFNWTLTARLAGDQRTTSTQRTRHVIYTLLGRPKAPWGPDDDPRDFELPWGDVLERACDWARGASDATEAAIRIATRLHGLAPDTLRFAAEDAGHSSLIFGGTDRFDCTKFLTHLQTATHALRVNCTDCAILVSSFANILGCDLYQSEMGSLFATNPIRLIGFLQEATTTFNYHEVAWEYPCDSTARLFDCCLQVDGDSDPAGGAFVPLLPLNIVFDEPADPDYHFRLVQPGATCMAFEGLKKRRKIARETFLLNLINPKLETILKERFAFSSWHEVPSPDRLFVEPIDSLMEGFLPAGWKLQGKRVLEGKRDHMSLSETIWQAATGNHTALRALTYKCASVKDARQFLLNLLGGFQLPLVERRFGFENDFDHVEIGELAFSVPDEVVLLFVRSNLVVYIQNAGKATSSVFSFAHDIDKRILRILRAEERFQLQSALELTELHNDRLSTTNLTSSERKETNQMLSNIVNTRWSSNRPVRGAGTSPNDTRPDGIFEFETYDPITGAVEGEYYDVNLHETERFEGSIRFDGHDSHIFLLTHVVPRQAHRRRLYQGKTAANDGRVLVVAGRWQELPNEASVAEQPRIEADAAVEAQPGTAAFLALQAQQEGVWVVTKP